MSPSVKFAEDKVLTSLSKIVQLWF